MATNIGYATKSKDEPLAPFEFDRQPVGGEDVKIDITHCGVCHSDIHQARDEFGGALATNYPCMPGHEIVGTVAEIGSDVKKYAVGDRVGVGCLVYWGDESQRGVEEEQYQMPPATFTYNTPDPKSGEVTFGGYSDQIVVNEHFVLRIPDSIPSEQAAPILCAGVTTWSPLKHWNVGPGSTVAIAGLGGLGHMATQLAKARGADKVIALTSSSKKAAAAKQLGADQVIDVNDDEAMKDAANSIDFLLSTIPTTFDLNPYIELMKHDSTLISVGMLVPLEEKQLNMGSVSMKRVTIGGSLIGSIAETQEVLDFCAENNIAAQVKVIPINEVNDAFEKINNGDIEFRYVIDSSTLTK